MIPDTELAFSRYMFQVLGDCFFKSARSHNTSVSITIQVAEWAPNSHSDSDSESEKPTSRTRNKPTAHFYNKLHCEYISIEIWVPVIGVFRDVIVVKGYYSSCQCWRTSSITLITQFTHSAEVALEMHQIATDLLRLRINACKIWRNVRTVTFNNNKWHFTGICHHQ